MPQRRSLDDIYGTAPAAPPVPQPGRPGGRPSLDDIYAGVEAPSDAARTWGDWLGMGVRGVAGFLPGGPVGSAGAGAAELIGQGAEWLSGSRKSFNLAQVPVQAGLGYIPFRTAGSIIKSGLKGSGLAAASGGTTALVEGLHEMNAPLSLEDMAAGRERPTFSDVLGNVASQAKFGGLVGFGGGAASRWLGDWLSSGRKTGAPAPADAGNPFTEGGWGKLTPGKAPDPRAGIDPVSDRPLRGLENLGGDARAAGSATFGPRPSLDDIYGARGTETALDAAGYRGPGYRGPGFRDADPDLPPMTGEPTERLTAGTRGGQRSPAEIALATVDRFLRGVEAPGGTYGIRPRGADDLPSMTGAPTDRLTMFKEPLEGAPLRRTPPRDRPTPSFGGSEPPIRTTPNLVEPPTAAATLDRFMGGAASPATRVARTPTETAFSKLSPAEQRELQMMAEEMEMLPYQPREWKYHEGGEVRTAANTDLAELGPDYKPFWEATGGAKVYQHILDQGETKSGRGAVLEAIRRIIGGGRSTAIGDRALAVMRGRLAGVDPEALGERHRNVRLPGEAVDPLPADPDWTPTWGAKGAPAPDTPEAAAAPPAGPKPRVPAEIVSAWLGLKPRWAQTVAQQAGDDIPFTVDPSEDLAEFSARVLGESDPRQLMGAERKARAAFEKRTRGDAGFITPDALATIGGGLTGAAATPLVDDDPDWLTALGMTAAGTLAGRGVGSRMGRGTGVPVPRVPERPATPARRMPSLDELDPELPAPSRGVDALSDFEVLDPHASRLNASGESGASMEAMSRQRGMSTRGEQFVVYDRLGQRRPLIGPDAVDYPARAGETYGVEGPSGFRVLDDRGGRIPPGARAPRDAGFVRDDLLYTGGAGAAGLLAGPFLSDSPAVGMLGGAGTGILAAMVARNPRLLSSLSYSNILSGSAIPTSLAGNVGGVAAHMAEHPETAGQLGRGFFSGRTLADAKEGFLDRRLTATGRYMLDDETPDKLTYASRALGAPDYATRSAMQRVGATADEAGQYTLSGDPTSSVGRAIVNLAQHPAAQWFMPVAKTAVNVAERGLERTPGVGSLPAVRAWTNAPDALVRRRQAIGALMMLAGAGTGYLTGESGPLDGLLPDWVGKYGGALTGPYALPSVAMSAAGQRLSDELAAGTGGRDAALSALEAIATTGIRQLPLPAPWANPFNPPEFLRRMVPYGGAMRELSPVRPREFDTSGDPLFGPALAQIPFLNEQLFERRAGTRNRR